MQGFSNKYLDLQVNISSYPLSLLIFSLSQNLLIFARSLTKIGHASVNQALMVMLVVEPKFYTKYLIVIGVDLGKINDVGNDIFRTQRC